LFKSFYEKVRLKVACRNPLKISVERLFEMDKKLYMINIVVEGYEQESGMNLAKDSGDDQGDDDEETQDDDYFDDLGDSQEMDADIGNGGHVDRGRLATSSGGKPPAGAKIVADHYASEGSVEKKVLEKSNMVEDIAAETEVDIQGMKDGASGDEGSEQGRVDVGISQSPASCSFVLCRHRGWQYR
jgi:hypothetical protein